MLSTLCAGHYGVSEKIHTHTQRFYLSLYIHSHLILLRRLWVGKKKLRMREVKLLAQADMSCWSGAEIWNLDYLTAESLLLTTRFSACESISRQWDSVLFSLAIGEGALVDSVPGLTTWLCRCIACWRNGSAARSLNLTEKSRERRYSDLEGNTSLSVTSKVLWVS